VNKQLFRRTALVVSLLALTACGPGIGLKTDFQNYAFEVGRTTRDEVVRQLGLPQKILKDQDGREHLLYEGSTRLLGVCIGCGDASAPAGAIPMMVNDAAVKSGAEYVFDERSVLVTKFEPRKKTK
jgi:hypothetical protein